MWVSYQEIRAYQEKNYIANILVIPFVPWVLYAEILANWGGVGVHSKTNVVHMHDQRLSKHTLTTICPLQ